MAEYHVGYGVFGIYAGTLNKKGKMMSLRKSEVTHEACDAVAEYLLMNGKQMSFYYKDEKYVLKVEKVEEVKGAQPKTGKWINANDGKWNTVEVLKCSVCGEIDNRMYRTDNFCPNCGARMLKDGD